MKNTNPFIAVNPIKITPHGLLVVGHQGTKLVRESELKKLQRHGVLQQKHPAPVQRRPRLNTQSHS